MFVQSTFKSEGKTHKRGEAWKGSGKLSEALSDKGLIAKAKPKAIGHVEKAPKSITKAEKVAKAKAAKEAKAKAAKEAKEAKAKGKK